MASKIVLIDWVDSNCIHGWRPDDCKNDILATCRSVGILKYVDDDKVTIALSESDCDSIFETLTIPRGCIKSMRYLRVR